MRDSDGNPKGADAKLAAGDSLTARAGTASPEPGRMTEHTTNAAEELDYALRSALRFAASRSAITAEQERGILAAFDRHAQADNVLRDKAERFVRAWHGQADAVTINRRVMDLDAALKASPTTEPNPSVTCTDCQHFNQLEGCGRTQTCQPGYRDFQASGATE